MDLMPDNPAGIVVLSFLITVMFVQLLDWLGF